MVKRATPVGALESIVGTDGILSGEKFPVDGVTPPCAVGPETYEQVAEVLRYANRQRLAVIPYGAGTMMHLGNPPARYDIALSLTRLSQVIEHEPADLTVTCQAGATVADLQQALAGARQMVGLGPFRERQATVGGVLATNASGALRHSHGTPRDFTIGTRVVTAEGKITRAGGKVVKNVAGYDLCKLYIGSLGTLAVIVEATFKVTPMPAQQRTLHAALPSARAACAVAAEVERRGLNATAIELRRAADGPFWLRIELGGTATAVERSAGEVRGLVSGHGADLSESGPADRSAEALECRYGVLPSRVAGLVERLDAIAPPALQVFPTVGVVRAAWPDVTSPSIDPLREAAGRLGGSCTVERCPPTLKGQFDVFGHASAPALALMRRIKEQWDPGGVLSPGRFLGRI